MKLKYLGFAIGTGVARNSYSTSLEIMTPSYSDEQGFTPAQSVSVNGVDNIKQLLQLCEEVIKAFDNLPKS